MTDDQMPSTLSYMEAVQSELVAKGMTFENSVNTLPVCCPSRAVIQRGQYPHNTKVFTNTWPRGGYFRFRANGLQDSTVATWLNDAGYQTGYFGRYMNEHKGSRVPGWDTFFAYVQLPGGEWRIAGTKRYVKRPRVDTVAAARTLSFLSSAAGGEEPAFAFISFDAPHAPYHHPDWTDRLYRDVQAPRTPDFNEADVSDKPRWVSSLPPLTPRQVANVDGQYRNALRSLVRIDNFVGNAVSLLEAKGELDNTYIFFYTDNGAHTGLHRLPYGKQTAFESDVGFPLIARGPGIAPGTLEERLVGNHDIAPTIADLAEVQEPAFVDGRTVRPLLEGTAPSWRSAILSYGPHTTARYYPPEWYALRTGDWKYVEYITGEKELYDLVQDPYEVENLAGTMPEVEAALSARLESLKGCAASSCREAEGQ